MKTADWLGALWPEWNIEGVLGNGAFGTVYRIKRQDMGGTYYAALKAISFPNNPADVDVLRQSGMNEPQIAEYYEGIANKVACEFALMERLKGRTNIVSYEDHKILRRSDGIGWVILIRMELLTPMNPDFRSGKNAEQDAIRLGKDICCALEDCQQENVIHRDLKPANIFLSSHGDYKLGDFGIAVSLNSLNGDAGPCGTYSYMAPEVYRNQSYDSSVDTYALGLILYRMLNYGRAPLLPLPPEKLTQGMVDQANQARWNGAVLPRPAFGSDALVSVVMRACAYEPEHRYRSAAEMRSDLEQCLKPAHQSQPVAAAPQPTAAAPHSVYAVSKPAPQPVYAAPKPAPQPAAAEPKSVRLPPHTDGPHLRHNTMNAKFAPDPEESKSQMNSFFSAPGDL